MGIDKIRVLGATTAFASLDQISKAVAVSSGHSANHNPGITLGLGRSVPEPLWIVVSVGVLLAVWVFGDAVLHRSRLRPYLLGAITGGIVGNLVDRVVRGPEFFHGAVVDWLHIPGLPVTNLADLMLRLGGLALIMHELAASRTARRLRLRSSGTRDR
jgi:signal peptidase II